MSALAVILARAGSRGVPGKNTRPVGGRPCLAWTIGAALAEPAIGATVVSTDDPDARDIAASMGIAVVDRPAELASDHAPIDGAVRHAASRGPGASGDGPVVILYGNVPVRPPGLIGAALRLLGSSGADSVQSYAPVGKRHPWWTAVVDPATGGVRPWEGAVLNHHVFRRQELPPAHVPDGGVLAVTRDALFLRTGAPPGPHAFLGVDRRGLVTGEGEIVDIDTEVDALVADALLRRRAEAGERAA